MSVRTNIAAVSTGAYLALSGVIALPAVAAAGTPTATAPQQLTNAYPLGPQRLCCNGQSGVNGQTSSNGQRTPNPQSGSNPGAGSRPTAGVATAHGGTQRTVEPGPRGSSGGLSAELVTGVGAVAALLLVGVGAAFRTRRRSRPLPAPGASGLPAVAHLTGPSTAARHAAGNTTAPARRFSWERSRSGASTAAGSDELKYRRLDEAGDAGGAFNLGVLLHERGEVADATAAYRRAEQRGDPDAGFNLGVLLYETGDLEGAETAWRRSAGRGHIRAAANLLFLSRRRGGTERGGVTPSGTPESTEFEELSYRREDEAGTASANFNLGVLLHQRGDVSGAADAYERAEQRGDPDAAFNLGVLLYEVGDFDGAEAAWRRDAERGHSRATQNLEFLRRQRRNELQRAGVAGEDGD